MALVDVFPSLVELLSTDNLVEGVVIATDCGRIFKWKGIEETFSKDRAANFRGLEGQIGDKWPMAWQAIKAVAKFALRKQVRILTENPVDYKACNGAQTRQHLI